ncbi:MAG: hypothetical protein LBR55_03770, partial [Bacteroidales bacterium]|nr:hypothetical protein [Bacteroidales bacterium]
MKKTILTFGLFAALGLTTALFHSCNDGDAGPNNGNGNQTENPGGSSNTDGTFTTAASNVINSSSQIATAKTLLYWETGNWDDADYSYGYDTIAQAPYQNNGFTLALPASVPSRCLITIADDMPNGITISDKTVKGTSEIDIEAYDKDVNNIGYFYLQEEGFVEEEGGPEAPYVMWIYVDKN